MAAYSFPGLAVALLVRKTKLYPSSCRALISLWRSSSHLSVHEVCHPTGPGKPRNSKKIQTSDTNGASPQPDERVLLQCKNLTHLHQIFDFKISSNFGGQLVV